MSLQKEVDRHRNAMHKLVKEFRHQIEGLPDNPNIKRLSPNGFIANFSDVSASGTMERDGKKVHVASNWSPEHHDFKTQYRHLSEMVQKNPERAIHIVHEAVMRETIRVGQGDSRFTINLHPQVVSHLRGFLKSEGIIMSPKFILPLIKSPAG